MLILNRLNAMTDFSDHQFEKAYDMVCNTDMKFPPDVMLTFYAYYKRATEHSGFYTPRKEKDIRNGFKANALLQVKDITKEQARKRYIEMVEKYIGEV